MAAALVWPLAAFGGAYAWTLPPLVAIVLGAIAATRPSLFADRALDAALAAALAAGAIQLLPLPPALRHLLSPHAAAVDAALEFDAATRLREWRPLTLDPAATLVWLPAGAAAVGLFWSARAWFGADSARPTARVVAWTGLALSTLAIVQHYSSPLLIYWTFRPLDYGSRTAGPFVNRNHLATWLLLALPTTVGYLIARTAARSRGGRGLAGVARAFEEPATFWLIAAAGAMVAGLISTLSRSGLIGVSAAAAAMAGAARIGGRQAHRGWTLAIVVSAIVVAATLSSPGALLSRLETASTDPVGGRAAIWRQTLPIVRDFALVGTGVGSYQTAMLVYREQQRHPFFFNQAHDQYLQFAAEGGLLLGLPILLVVAAFARTAWTAMAADRTPIFWLRAGAAAGLVGIAVQSVWETGLRMPANAVLCAVVAAMVVHDAADRAFRGGRPRD